MNLSGYVTCLGQTRGTFTVLVGKSEGKRPLERPRSKREVNVTVDLKYLEVAHGRNRWRAVVDTVMNFWVPQNSGNFLTI